MDPAARRTVTRGTRDGSSGLHVFPLLALVTAATLACLAVAAHVGWIPAPPGMNLRALTPPPDAPGTQAVCGRCGVIEAVQAIDPRRGGPIHLGLSAPVALPQLGGLGQELGNLLGLLVIALAPQRQALDSAPRPVYATTVRFEDGSGRMFTAMSTPTWRPGDRVKVVNGRILPLDPPPHP